MNTITTQELSGHDANNCVLASDKQEGSMILKEIQSHHDLSSILGLDPFIHKSISFNSIGVMTDVSDLILSSDDEDDDFSIISIEECEKYDDQIQTWEDENCGPVKCVAHTTTITTNTSQMTTSDHLDEEALIIQRAQQRTMTTSQEVWNAITMLIAPCYCLYFILSGRWLSDEQVNIAKYEYFLSQSAHPEGLGCIESSLFPNLHALPPLPLVAIATGVILHAPVSILYHLMCAFWIPNGKERINHWSRRLDQAMIHVMSTFWAFGAIGKWDLLMVVSVLFNIYSIHQLYRGKFRPKGILIRMSIAILLQTLPYVRNSNPTVLVQLLMIYIASGWLFSKYPLGGYSHSVFHVLLAFAPHPVMVSSSQLINGQEQTLYAALCAVSKKAL